MEVIKPIDVYKHDPWDLPKAGNVGEEELYFFCKRGRKYRNSERPNRVTGSGFWKATGIDKPVHATGQEPHECIGLKKSLVYYRGNAGKGTKTDWMMHEFRLPPTTRDLGHHSKDAAREEAEVWTLCRIFKRLPSPRKHTPDPKPNTTTASVKHSNPADYSSKAGSSFESEHRSEQHTSFGDSAIGGLRRGQTILPAMDSGALVDDRNFSFPEGYLNSTAHQQPPLLGHHPGFWNPSSDELLTYGVNWDELGSVVERAANHKSHDLDRT